MNAADGSSSATAAHQLLSGVVTQLSKADPLSDSFSRHATAAVLSAQQAVRALDAASQPSKLHGSFHKVLELVLKRLSKGQVRAGAVIAITAAAAAAGGCWRQPVYSACLNAATTAGTAHKCCCYTSFVQAHEQALALQLFTACIRVCDAVTLLQKAVEWGTQISEALRKAAAAAAQQQAADAAAPAPACAVIQAACAAATELCSRLQQYVELPAVRREVSGVAPKLLQPLVAVLNSSSAPDSTQAAALQLVAALLRCVPSSLRPGLNNLERALQQRVLRTAAGAAGSSVSTAGGPYRQQVLAQAAVCVALLPAVSGEAGAWSETARRLMVSCHDVLDLLLMGLESRPVDTRYRSHLAGSDAAQQQGQAAAAAPGAASSSRWLNGLPWQQEQQEQQQQQGAAMRRQTVPVLLLVSFCMTALQHLLQQPFAVPVPVPGYSLSLLAARLHRFDAAAAVAAGAVPGSSTMYQELLVLQPQLQLAGWQLLQQVVSSCGQQLQLQGLLLRLVRQGMRVVQLSGPAGLQQQPPGVRSCLYETAALLLQATGLAGARALAAESMGCVVLELYGHTATAGKAGAAAGGQQRPAKRARKSGGATGTELGQFDPAAAVAAAAADEGSRLAAATPADLEAQGAVLGVLRGLLAAGGQVLPAQVRAHADAVAYHISATSAQLAVQLSQQPALSAAAAAAAGGSGSLAALQVAAYQALLASLLVPCSHRPPFLSQAVVLFRQGRASSNVGVAAVCQATAVQVEALLHPRATAMAGVRQYSGMEGVPALTKPRMWDAFAPQQQQQQPQQQQPEPSAAAAYAGPGLANGVQQQGSGPAGVDGPTAAAAAAAGPSQDNAAVVMGYPVSHTQQQQHQQQQQQQQQQQAPAVFQQQQQPPVSSHTPQTGNGMVTPVLQAPAPRAPAPQQLVMQQPPQAGSAMAIDADQPAAAAAVQDNQGVMDCAPPPQPVVRTAAPAAAAAGAKAAVFADDESSDSEGPMPEIDSGGEEASSSSEEDE
jgi:hypothetical protein